MRSAALVALLLWQAGAAAAADCRTLAQALVRSSSPSRPEIAAARGVCQAAHESGDARATYHLAFFPLGLDARFDAAEGARLMRMAADAGVPEASYWLAWQRESGPLLPDDPAQALRWYLRAAEGEHRLALARLARAYERGELGVRPDARRAADYRAREAACARREAERPAS